MIGCLSLLIVVAILSAITGVIGWISVGPTGGVIGGLGVFLILSWWVIRITNPGKAEAPPPEPVFVPPPPPPDITRYSTLVTPAGGVHVVEPVVVHRTIV